jgi:hypothetical protein
MKSSLYLVEVLLAQEPVCRPWNRSRPTPTPTAGQFMQRQAVQGMVQLLLGQEPAGETPICEARVHRPTRGQVWVAVFSGPAGGQIWRSTRLRDPEQALVVARKWEAQARRQRARSDLAPKKPVGRVRPPAGSTGICLLTQPEVAMLLNLSERSVREIQRRAFQKIRNHPVRKQIWQKYLAGELDRDFQTGFKPPATPLRRLADRFPLSPGAQLILLQLLTEWLTALGNSEFSSRSKLTPPNCNRFDPSSSQFGKRGPHCRAARAPAPTRSCGLSQPQIVRRWVCRG